MSVTKIAVGDLFASRAQTLVNTVNCVGIMGKGIALGFKERFPEMYRDYVERCERGEVKLGRPYLFKRVIEPWIVNFPTKDHWRSVSKLSAIVEGLEYLAAHDKRWGITSLAVPPLGCGNGQLEWSVVGPTLYRYLNAFDIPVELFAPQGTPGELLEREFLSRDRGKNGAVTPTPSRLPAAAVALVGVLSRITRERHHWPIGRIAFQKVAYFLTEAGAPTGLRYERGSFGPFAHDLKPLIGKLMNHGVIVEERQGQMFQLTPGPTYGDARNAYREQLKEWTPMVEHVADLFLRLTRTVDAEIAATVHFAAKTLRGTLGRRPTEREVLEHVLEWKIRRRPPLDEREIAEVIRSLNLLGWLELQPSADIPVDEDELMTA
jgi:O-acetyl-ADP-ribose deacetylase (regulator of RNase III)